MIDGDRDRRGQSGQGDVLKLPDKANMSLAPFDFVSFAANETCDPTGWSSSWKWNLNDLEEDAAEAMSGFESVRIALRICFEGSFDARPSGQMQTPVDG